MRWRLDQTAVIFGLILWTGMAFSKTASPTLETIRWEPMEGGGKLVVGTSAAWNARELQAKASNNSTIEISLPGIVSDHLGFSRSFTFDSTLVKTVQIEEARDGGVHLKLDVGPQAVSLLNVVTARSTGESTTFTFDSNRPLPEPLVKQRTLSVEFEKGALDKTQVEATSAAEGLEKETAAKKVDEKDIPIAKAGRTTTGAKTQTDRLIYTVVLLLLLGTLGAAGVYKMKRRGEKLKNRGVAIQVLSQFHFGPKRSLAIVQVAGETVLLGLTDHSITNLRTLALLDEEIPGQTPGSFERTPRQDWMDEEEDEPKKAVASKVNKSVRGEPIEEPEENFAMKSLSDVRDVVTNRLRGLRNLE